MQNMILAVNGAPAHGALGLHGPMRQFLIEVFRQRFMEDVVFELGVERCIEPGQVERRKGIPGSKLSLNRAWK